MIFHEIYVNLKLTKILFNFYLEYILKHVYVKLKRIPYPKNWRFLNIRHHYKRKWCKLTCNINSKGNKIKIRKFRHLQKNFSAQFPRNRLAYFNNTFTFKRSHDVWLWLKMTGHAGLSVDYNKSNTNSTEIANYGRFEKYNYKNYLKTTYHTLGIKYKIIILIHVVDNFTNSSIQK